MPFSLPNSLSPMSNAPPALHLEGSLNFANYILVEYASYDCKAACYIHLPFSKTAGK